MKAQQSYAQVKQEWNELFANPMIQKRNWQTLCFIQAVVIGVLCSGLMILSARKDVVPYIVEVDQLGRGVYSGLAKPVVSDDERIMRAYLYRYISQARAIITDGEAMKQNFTEVYQMSTPALQQNILDPYYRQNNPFEKARQLSRQIEPVSFLKQSEHTYIVEWREISRDLYNKVVSQEAWKAVLTISRELPRREHQLKENPLNPFGIYIKSLSWSPVK